MNVFVLAIWLVILVLAVALVASILVALAVIAIGLVAAAIALIITRRAKRASRRADDPHPVRSQIRRDSDRTRDVDHERKAHA